MRVFISYSSKEYDKANALKQVLEANEISCWMAPQSIPSGSDYSCEIPKAIKSCEIFLLILSEASQVSRWVPKELDNAINEGKIIIPFHTDESNLTEGFNFMLSNVQRIEAFSRLSDAYKQLIDQIKSFDNEKKIANKKNVCPVSFNSIPGRDYIMAREADSNLSYRKGPIMVKGEDSYWILTAVNNMCPDESVVAENVRLSMSIKQVSPTETVVESVILCQDAEQKEVKQSIHFIGEEPFELEYCSNSAYLYSEYYGLYGSRGMPLTDDILAENGTILGFWQIDGKIPGGLNNSVTVSIEVRTKKMHINGTDTSNAKGSMSDNTTRNICPISFNTIPGRNYIMAKEANPELSYRKGPIVVKEEDSYWILTAVNNMCSDENVVAEDVRLSMSIEKKSPTETVVESVILCKDAEQKEVRQSIHFIGDEPFELEYYPNSAYLYSEYYGLVGSKGMPLTDDIMTGNGTVLGFWKIDGRIPGGLKNSVTVSIKVHTRKQ